MRILRGSRGWVGAAVGMALVASACSDTPVVEPEPEVDSPPTISLSAPAGGNAVAPGGTVDIAWVAADSEAAVTVDLFYERRLATNRFTIAENQTGSSYSWTVPNENLFGVKVIAVATDTAGQTAEDETDVVFAIVTADAQGYVTSDACANCHPDKQRDINNSGHPYKLNKVVNGQPPTYPNSAVPTPPQGFSWSDVTYVIGGYRWKARFLNDSGWIMTGGDGTGIDGVDVQYNLPRADIAGGLDSGWTAYHDTDTERKPYDCGACHTTGWLSLADNGGVHQDGLEGIAGTWSETGIRCEACHGPGLDHVVSISPSDITVDESAALCGSCHNRSGPEEIDASGGFIRHHEQWDELSASPHAALSCNDCHEPHIGVAYGNAEAGGITTTCESCHASIVLYHTPVDCEDCHMARATKSAQAASTFEGDVRTHLFRINTNPWPKDSMFVDSLGGTVARNAVTLDIACYSCHVDPLTGEGGTRSEKTLDELAAVAAVIHQQ